MLRDSGSRNLGHSSIIRQFWPELCSFVDSVSATMRVPAKMTARTLPVGLVQEVMSVSVVARESPTARFSRSNGPTTHTEFRRQTVLYIVAF